MALRLRGAKRVQNSLDELLNIGKCLSCPEDDLYSQKVLRIRSKIKEELRSLSTVHAAIQALRDKHQDLVLRDGAFSNNTLSLPETRFDSDDIFISLLGAHVSPISPISFQFSFQATSKKQFFLVLDRYGTVDGVELWSKSLCHLPAFFDLSILETPKSEKEWWSLLPVLSEHVIAWERRRNLLQKLKEECGSSVVSVSYNDTRSKTTFFVRPALKGSSAVSGFLECTFEDSKSGFPSGLRCVDSVGQSVASLSFTDIIAWKHQVELAEGVDQCFSPPLDGEQAPWSSAGSAEKACLDWFHNSISAMLEAQKTYNCAFPSIPL